MTLPDFEHFFDLVPDILCISDGTQGRLIRCNAAFYRVLGWDDQLLGTSWWELVHPHDVAATRREFEWLLGLRLSRGSYRPPPSFVNRCRTAAGNYRSIQWQAHHDPASNLLYVYGRDIDGVYNNHHAVRDALERERAIAEALRISESRLIEAQHLAMIGSWEIDHPTTTLWWSEEVYRIFEVDPDESTPLSVVFRQRVHPDDHILLREVFDTALAQQSPYQLIHRLLMPDGRVKYVREQARTSYAADGSPLRSIGTVQDITAWKETDAALALSHARFEAALEGVAAGFFILDSEWRYYFVNSIGAQLVQRTREQLQGKVIWEEFPEVVGTIFDTVYHDVMETRRPQVFTAHYEPLQTWFEVHVFPYVGGISIFFLDTSERHKAEQALALKDQAIASALNAIVIADAAGHPVYVNPAFLRLWGYTDAAEVIGQGPWAFGNRQEVEYILSQLHRLGAWQGELQALRKDGTTFDAIFSANIVRNNLGEISHLVASILDISDAKRLQAQFMQAQKMESVGRLAGGVAHDFNNLLTVMKGYVDLALQALDPQSALARDLQQVDSAIDSAAGLTQQLLTFSRRQIIAPQAINLNTVLLRVQRMLRRLLGEDIDLRFELADDLALVMFDPNQCEQIVINLAINARDAMPAGGTLLIETSMLVLDTGYTHYHPDLAPGAYVLLAISDTGVGMSAEVQAHLFEPFFTTKEVGKGTGLGLAMVYGAVVQNGGRIMVYSEPGQGTTLKIYLPQVEQVVVEEALQPKPALELPPGTQTIILVEDDLQVRTLTTRMLEQQGYRVHAFADGATALHVVPTLREPLHLLITDVVMPGMNGRVLADRLCADYPQLKVLFTSGYTTNIIEHHGVLAAGVAFLVKPYSAFTLAQRVRALLM
jgi:PAS domain S-box-containing protein